MAQKKVIELCQGHRTKEEKQIRQEAQDKLKRNAYNIKPPKWLTKGAKKEFKRVVEGLIELEIVDELDLSILAIYANAFDNYVSICEIINEEGLTIQYTNKAGETNTVISPHVQAQQKYIDVIMKCSTKLGLSISDRLKLVIPSLNEKPKNKFEEFI